MRDALRAAGIDSRHTSSFAWRHDRARTCTELCWSWSAVTTVAAGSWVSSALRAASEALYARLARLQAAAMRMSTSGLPSFSASSATQPCFSRLSCGSTMPV